MRTYFLLKLGIKILTNSIKKKINIPTIPYKADILPLYNCNLKCVMCNNWKREVEIEN